MKGVREKTFRKTFFTTQSLRLLSFPGKPGRGGRQSDTRRDPCHADEEEIVFKKEGEAIF